MSVLKCRDTEWSVSIQSLGDKVEAADLGSFDAEPYILVTQEIEADASG
jgi:hypothetical protein